MSQSTPGPGMWVKLSEEQRAAQKRFAAFANEHVAPYAAQWDRDAALPPEIREKLRDEGYLGAGMPTEVGGGGMDAVTYGLLTEEIGRACASTRSLLTAHDMVAYTVWRWGKSLEREVEEDVVTGRKICAIGLSEPNVGSDATAIETTARVDGDRFVINGRKKWITFGQIADYFLVFARCEGTLDGKDIDGKLTAFLVDGDAPGFTRKPLHGVIGSRATMLAELFFEDCRVPAHRVLGRVGFGFSHVASTTLDHGRFSVAWGSVGIAQACLEACIEYTQNRVQFRKPIAEHQLIRRKITEMTVQTHAARLLCCRAATLRQDGDPAATAETLQAKYFASRVAVQAANDAIQLHGGVGLTEQCPVERYLRDAKVTEIIEGSTQIQQILIPRFPLPEL